MGSLHRCAEYALERGLIDVPGQVTRPDRVRFQPQDKEVSRGDRVPERLRDRGREQPMAEGQEQHVPLPRPVLLRIGVETHGKVG